MGGQDLPLDDPTITEIHDVLSGFLKDGAEAWAPIISSWSLDLLGKAQLQISYLSNPVEWNSPHIKKN